MVTRKLQGSFLLMLVVILALVLVGCKSKSSSFYVLSPLKHVSSQSCNMVLGVGPLTLPRYLDQPQIVTRLSTNQLHLNEFHRWAEPLNANVLRVLTRNLKQLLRAKRVVPYPWSSDAKVNYKVQVTVTRFDAADRGGTNRMIC